jgi:murein DD-endopeptidase MepM/ murein hydrolase activator NlpD
MMKSFLFAALACFFVTSVDCASALRVHFYPAGRVYAYDLGGNHDAHTLMVHNVAILNDGAAPVTITAVSVQLLDGERVIEERRLGPPELERSAGNGAVLSGDTWRMLSFQFGGDQLVPSTMHLGRSTTLAPGEALLFGSQIFAYRGQRNFVRVVVNNNAASGSIPIRSTMSQTEFLFPLQGVWYAGSGPGFDSPHRWSPMEEFAFDLLLVDAHGRTHRGDGSRFTDYYAYGKPVFAAAEGVVVSVVTDEVEDLRAMQQPGETVEAYYARLQQDQAARLARGTPGIAGDSVVLDHGNGEFSLYAHLKPGSVRVRKGEHVARGQQLGEVGSSGNSTEPHLHFQVCDGPEPLHCAGIPIRFQEGHDTLRNPAHAPQVGDFMSRPENDH